MTRSPLSAALFSAILLLSACGGNDEPTVVGGNPDSQAAELATAPPVELPPAVTSSKTYRCADGTVVYADFLSDTKSANLRTDAAGTPTRAIAPEAGQAMVAEGGWSLSGTGDRVQIGVPGKPAQACKA